MLACPAAPSLWLPPGPHMSLAIRRVIIEKYYQRLTLDFDTNKRICEEVAIIQSKRLRNKIAGFTTVGWGRRGTAGQCQRARGGHVAEAAGAARAPGPTC